MITGASKVGEGIGFTICEGRGKAGRLWRNQGPLKEVEREIRALGASINY
jgi:hypothetical protein